ncbi:hypothetical protein GOP47_0025082, partial [Adiantum capillus-veneris]
GHAERPETMQQILEEIWEMVQEQERICDDLLAQIRSLAVHTDGGDIVSLMYAEGVCDLLAGLLYWSTLTWRYAGPHPIPWNTSPSYIVIPSSPLHSISFLCQQGKSIS